MKDAEDSPAQSADWARRRVVLVGAGHAHLYTLARAVEFSRRGFELTAIAPESFWYSGLATGVLGGRYSPEQDQVDVEALVAHAGGRFIRARVATIDPSAGLVRLESGVAVAYDVLSLNLGSETRPLPGENHRVFAIKPLRNLWRLRQALAAGQAADQSPRIVIAGGGASGCEIAANLRALLGRSAEITVLARGAEIASSLAPAAARALAQWLHAQDISVRTRATVCRIQENTAVTEEGEQFTFDYLVNATGLHAPPILAQSGLPVSDRGELLVDDRLRAMSDSRIFAGGDCIRFARRELAKIGVYAVREAPVIFHNLLATLEGRPLRAFKPQRHFLLILNLGNGYGLASWRDLYWLGRLAFWLKDRIDRAFLARYQT